MTILNLNCTLIFLTLLGISKPDVPLLFSLSWPPLWSTCPAGRSSGTQRDEYSPAHKPTGMNILLHINHKQIRKID